MGNEARPRRARVLRDGRLAGELSEGPDGYRFQYDPGYLRAPDARAVSWTLPTREGAYVSRVLFPFFQGLLAEGALAELQCRTLHLDPEDAFGRLIRTCRGDVIGCVTVEEIP